MSDKQTEPHDLRLLVCGGRDFNNREAVYGVLDRAHAHKPITCIIAGGAKGVDRLAADWARDRGIALAEFPADWDTHGRAAGPIRNKQMLEEGKPMGVVAFPGGIGTANMIRQADAAGIKVWRSMG